MLPAWLARRAAAVLDAVPGPVEVPGGRAAVVSAAERAGADAAAGLRELALTDLDEQRTTPLSVLRDAVAPAEAALRAAGAFASVAAPRGPGGGRPGPAAGGPDGLVPRSWSEVDDELAELALVWGATKAAAHRWRHRPPERPA